MYSNLLSLAIWVPIVAGVLVLTTGSDSRAALARIVAFVGALAGFLVTLPLFTGFDRLSGGYQFTEFHSWIPALNINYALGVDGVSVLFVILNSFITLMVVLAGWQVALIGASLGLLCAAAIGLALPMPEFSESDLSPVNRFRERHHARR